MTDHAQIDLLIGTGNETVKFSVTGGSAKVHITGYEVLEETYDGFGDDDDATTAKPQRSDFAHANF